jgi:hypothetical protein
MDCVGGLGRFFLDFFWRGENNGWCVFYDAMMMMGGVEEGMSDSNLDGTLETHCREHRIYSPTH